MAYSYGYGSAAGEGGGNYLYSRPQNYLGGGGYGGYGGYGGFGGAAPQGRGGATQGRPGQPGSDVPQIPYNPAAPGAQGVIGTMTEAGEGLLDPSSAYSQSLRDEYARDLGKRTQAQQQGAVLRAARAGFGAGASPELLETQEGIGREGLRATGEAGAELGLAGTRLAPSFLSPALSGQMGLQGQALSGYLSQQNLNAQQAYQQLQAEMEAQRLNQDAMFRELALMGL